MKQHRICPSCYYDEYGYACWDCDAWPCSCVPQEGDDAPEARAVPEEAVSVAEGGAGGVAPDAADAAGVHGVSVREASESDVAPEQEAAWVADIDHDPVHSCVLGEIVYLHGKRIRYLVKPEVPSE